MKFGIIGNTNKSGTLPAILKLIESLRQRNLDWVLHDRMSGIPELASAGAFVPREEMRDSCDAIIAFGGDGTMLSTGRMLAGSKAPLLGFNLGNLGFMAEFSVDAIDETLDEFIGGSCLIVERSLLEATFPEETGKSPLVALNDIVIDKRETRLMVNLDVTVNKDFLGRYTADGLIVATPTGSTAYALSVGGPVIVPGSEVILLAPIAPHMLTARPVVIPDSSKIEIIAVNSNQKESVHIIADGQNHHYLETSSKITIARHRHTVRLVKRASRTYFDVLRAKLLWGQRPSPEDRAGVTD